MVLGQLLFYPYSKKTMCLRVYMQFATNCWFLYFVLSVLELDQDHVASVLLTECGTLSLFEFLCTMCEYLYVRLSWFSITGSWTKLFVLYNAQQYGVLLVWGMQIFLMSELEIFPRHKCFLYDRREMEYSSMELYIIFLKKMSNFLWSI